MSQKQEIKSVKSGSRTEQSETKQALEAVRKAEMRIKEIIVIAMYVKPVSVEGVCEYDPNTHRWLLDISAIKKAMPELSDDEAASKQESYSRHVYQWFQFMGNADINTWGKRGV